MGGAMAPELLQQGLAKLLCLHFCLAGGLQQGCKPAHQIFQSACPPPVCRYAPPDVAGSDAITAPRSWHFSNRSDQLDEQQQEREAAQNPDVS